MSVFSLHNIADAEQSLGSFHRCILEVESQQFGKAHAHNHVQNGPQLQQYSYNARLNLAFSGEKLESELFQDNYRSEVSQLTTDFDQFPRQSVAPSHVHSDNNLHELRNLPSADHICAEQKPFAQVTPFQFGSAQPPEHRHNFTVPSASLFVRPAPLMQHGFQQQQQQSQGWS